MWSEETKNVQMGLPELIANWKWKKKEDKKERDRRREGSWQGIEQQENIESAGKELGKEGSDSGVEAIGEIWR